SWGCATCSSRATTATCSTRPCASSGRDPLDLPLGPTPRQGRREPTLTPDDAKAYGESNALLEVRMERPPGEYDEDVGARSIRRRIVWPANDALRGLCIGLVGPRETMARDHAAPAGPGPKRRRDRGRRRAPA